MSRVKRGVTLMPVIKKFWIWRKATEAAIKTFSE